MRVVDSGPLPNYSVVATMQPFFPPEIDPNSGARWYPSLMTMPVSPVCRSDLPPSISYHAHTSRPLAVEPTDTSVIHESVCLQHDRLCELAIIIQLSCGARMCMGCSCCAYAIA